MSEKILKEKYPQFRSKFDDVNNIQLHYVTCGEGSKVIVFLHGFPQIWYMWRDQLMDLGKNYTAVAPDMRGYNLSSKPKEIEEYRIDILVEDIRAFIEDHLKAKKVILVGHDWGGVVAYPFAYRHPELLEKLIIVNAPHPNVFAKLLAKNKDQQSSSQYVLWFRKEGTEDMLLANECAALMNIIKTPEMDFNEDDRTIYIEGFSQPGAIRGGLNYYRAGGLKPPKEGENISELSIAEGDTQIMRIKVPTLVIWGEKDTALTVHNLEGLDEFVPDLTIKRIPEGSHWVVNEQPKKINKIIREFIK
ncbi:MAG: alpha/beta fold hydrolase [Promethearchaeota archaeon]